MRDAHFAAALSANGCHKPHAADVANTHHAGTRLSVGHPLTFSCPASRCTPRKLCYEPASHACVRPLSFYCSCLQPSWQTAVAHVPMCMPFFQALHAYTHARFLQNPMLVALSQALLRACLNRLRPLFLPRLSAAFTAVQAVLPHLQSAAACGCSGRSLRQSGPGPCDTGRARCSIRGAGKRGQVNTSTPCAAHAQSPCLLH